MQNWEYQIVRVDNVGTGKSGSSPDGWEPVGMTVVDFGVNAGQYAYILLRRPRS